RRQSDEQSFPGLRASRKVKFRGQRLARGNARARNAVVETKHPNPASGKQMMDRSIVDWTGRLIVRRQSVEPPNVLKMRIGPLRRGHRGKVARRHFECLVQKSSWTARVDHEAHLDAQRFAFARAAQLDQIAREFGSTKRNAIEILRPLVDRFLDKELI